MPDWLVAEFTVTKKSLKKTTATWPDFNACFNVCFIYHGVKLLPEDLLGFQVKIINLSYYLLFIICLRLEHHRDAILFVPVILLFVIALRR